jgi:ferric-dicitrate binding protein FerR (iron transport regulator)
LVVGEKLGQKRFKSQRATEKQKELAAKQRRDQFRRIVAIISAVVIIATGSLTGALLYQNTDEDSAKDESATYSLPDYSVAVD